MVFFNYATKEITAKIVYYGPGLCGKTTNLEFLHANVPEHSHGKLISLATKTDRTLFFDLLPVELGTIRGMKTRLQLYTVPGQVFYNSTRKLVLKGVDGIVFVVDSQEQLLEANIESYQNLKANLRDYGLDLKDTPTVIQFNKRDLPNILSVESLNEKINEYNAPIFEAVATTGIGVQETLRGITKLVLNKLSERDRADAAARAAKAAPTKVAAATRKLDEEPPPPPPPPARQRPSASPPSSFDFQEEELDSFVAGLEDEEPVRAMGDATVQLTPELVRQAMEKKKSGAAAAAAAPPPPSKASSGWDVWDTPGGSSGAAETPELELGGEDFDDPFAGIALDATPEPESASAGDDVSAFAKELAAAREDRGLGWEEAAVPRKSAVESAPARKAPAPAPPRPEPPLPPPPAPEPPPRRAARPSESEEKIDFRAMLQAELDKENDPFFSPHLTSEPAAPEPEPAAPAWNEAAADSPEEEPAWPQPAAEEPWPEPQAPSWSEPEPPPAAPEPTAEVWADETPVDPWGAAEAPEAADTSDPFAVPEEAEVPEGAEVTEEAEVSEPERASHRAPTPAGRPEREVDAVPSFVAETEIELPEITTGEFEVELPMPPEPASEPSTRGEPPAETTSGSATIQDVDVPIEIAVPRDADRIVLRVALKIHVTRR